MQNKEVRVSSSTTPSAVAGSIAQIIKETGAADVMRSK